MAEDFGERRSGLAIFAPALASAAAAAWFASMTPDIAAGAVREGALPWLPSLGVSFAFRIDGLALVFALLVTGIGALILAYAAEYFRHHPQRDRLLALLGLFELSMLGLVLADDALTLFLFWEGTTVTSFLLIGFDGHKAEARANALQALVVTGLGGVALLAGLLILARFTGVWRLSEMAAYADAIRADAIYLPVFALVAVGCFAKSAQVPFHFWLPNAMAAPTAVSAYLHSATMVKAGVYLLARFAPTLGDTALWSWTLTLAGGATMLLGAVWSLRQTDLKLALAHTTVMALGTLTLFLGVGTEEAVVAAMTFLIVHAFYKAALFLLVGVLDKKAGSREADALGGLGRAMPLSFAIALLAGASMAGLPPFFGFVAKEALFEGALSGGLAGALALVATAAASAMMVAIAGAVGLSPFLGARRSPKAEPGDAPFAMMLGPAVLAALGLFFGLSPGLAGHDFAGPAAASALGRPVETHLALWHGVGLPLFVSASVLGAGAVLYAALPRLRAALAHAEVEGTAPVWGVVRARHEAGLPEGVRPPPRPLKRVALFRFEGGYDAALRGLFALAALVGERLQSGRPSFYLRVGFATMSLMALGSRCGVARAAVRLPAAAADRDRRGRPDGGGHADAALHHPALSQDHRPRGGRRGRRADLRALRRDRRRDHAAHGGDAVRRHHRGRDPEAAAHHAVGGARSAPGAALECGDRRAVRGGLRRRGGGGAQGRNRPVGDRLLRAGLGHARVRAQHRQCHLGRLPRARHDGRDRGHRGGGRRGDGAAGDPRPPARGP
jgi:multicomponent Na+:H+ antiporter subunit A